MGGLLTVPRRLDCLWRGEAGARSGLRRHRECRGAAARIVSRWQDLDLPNRMVVVSVIAACLVRLYGTTRSLEERNRQLEAKVKAEGRTANA
jgi:hypothetical protein